MALHTANQTSFKKGDTPWNKGTRGIMVAWNKGITGVLIGENANRWKGGLPNCLDCGKQLSQRHSKTNRCSKCFHLIPELRNLRSAIQIGKRVGIENPQWAGDNVSYRSLHKWVRRWLGDPIECRFCGFEGCGHLMHWANISRQYKRELDDWISLCSSCHGKFDKEGGGSYFSTNS